MEKGPLTILGMGNQALRIMGMANQPLTVPGIVIVLVGGGYYYRDAGYWYPAWGYDPNYERYDYDGPIYTYGDLLPDQVIINVQRVLQQLGYYTGDLNGSLGVDTRQALTAYQQDYGLDATGVVDEATVRSLGLI
jgi:Putative peptidoglycan binding domain